MLECLPSKRKKTPVPTVQFILFQFDEGFTKFNLVRQIVFEMMTKYNMVVPMFLSITCQNQLTNDWGFCLFFFCWCMRPNPTIHHTVPLPICFTVSFSFAFFRAFVLFFFFISCWSAHRILCWTEQCSICRNEYRRGNQVSNLEGRVRLYRARILLETTVLCIWGVWWFFLYKKVLLEKVSDILKICLVLGLFRNEWRCAICLSIRNGTDIGKSEFEFLFFFIYFFY